MPGFPGSPNVQPSSHVTSCPVRVQYKVSVPAKPQPIRTAAMEHDMQQMVSFMAAMMSYASRVGFMA